MDTLSHGLWALALFWGTNYRWWAFLVGMLPDLLSFGLLFVLRLSDHVQMPRGPPPTHMLPDWVFISYDITHSFVTWAVIGVALYFVARRVWPIVFAAAAHIALDIPTHCSYFPTPFLWPIPHPKFCGVSWGHPVIFWANWISLGILFALILTHELQKHRHTRQAIASPSTTSQRKMPAKLKKRRRVR